MEHHFLLFFISDLVRHLNNCVVLDLGFCSNTLWWWDWELLGAFYLLIYKGTIFFYS